MKSYLVMTVLGNDRPGLVSSLADTVASHGGNWLESRMARLAGQFAGIVRIECPSETADALINELQTPGNSGLTILAEEDVRLADVDAGALDSEIAKVRSDASDPGDETRRKRAAERLAYLEALRAALN